MNKQDLLILENISKHFKEKVALKDISLTLKKGEILGFLGPSGSGKTTTIKFITGQLNPTSGYSYVLGVDSTELTESLYEQIGIVSDTSGLYERLSVYNILTTFAELLNVSFDKIDQLLERVGLLKQRKQIVGKLSKGQKQKLIIARSILHSPRILFLDEPTSGLDPVTANNIQDLLIELKNDGMAIFLTTHNMEEASKLCDHVALLDQGIIIEYGSPQEICLRHNDNKQVNVLDTNGQQHVCDNIKELAQFISNHPIETIHSNQPTLEDVFIKVTGKELTK